MRVTFAENSEMILVPSLCESPDKCNIWFTKQELCSFKSDLVNHIRWIRLQCGHNIILPASDILGMEKFISRQVTEECILRKWTLMREILDPNDHDIRTANADRLARISSENSKWARARARLSAMFLEEELIREHLLQHISTFRQQNCARSL